MARKGNIFVATWGYEQTNADFFQVIKVTPKSVTVRHIRSKEIESPKGSMSGYATPRKNSFDRKKITRRIYIFDGKEHFNAGNSMGSAGKWDGKPVAVSWYG